MPSRKRRRSWGTINSKGKDIHVLRWVESTPEGRKRRCRTFRGTYAQAELELARIRVEHADDAPCPTIGKAYEMWYRPWLEERVATGAAKARTAELYTSCWESVLRDKWAGVPLDSIKPAEVQKWLSSLTASIARMSIIVLRAIGDFAVRYEVVETNKFRIKYSMPTKNLKCKDASIYDLAQAESMLETLKGTSIEAPFILACFGSCRTGESLGVRCSEVMPVESHGLTLAVVPIVRRMKKTGDEPAPDGDLKNPQSVRHIVIPEPYGTRLLQIASSGREWLADSDGKPMNRGVLRVRWKKIAAERYIPFANLRASWRTFAQYDWGIDYDTLEVLMGHALGGVTGKHYLKPTVENLVEAVAEAVTSARKLGKVR